MILCDTVLEWPRNEQVCQLDTWFFTYWYWWYCMFVIVSPFLGGHWIAIALTELQVLWMHPLGCDPACDIGPGGVAGNGEYGRIRIWHLETCECMMLRSWFLTALDFLKGFWFGLFVCLSIFPSISFFQPSTAGQKGQVRCALARARVGVLVSSLSSFLFPPGIVWCASREASKGARKEAAS